ncbi:hypothetical protein SAMN02910293_01975 [Streptococcus henryi]|jgi:FtsZ-binding cell division protein ZapB|uniref:Uncharacterized protein n=1 Tax=Streptococcus henryi TaxID=439219 RepID=A0A1G6D5M1_9STRE|nr:hypothetical protein [Streptococcus henryi]SDB40205.1 hypothetical protein SAMN02910293_01975 [Streptococcus henryi]
MKLKHFLAVGLASYAGYQAYKNRERIKNTVLVAIETREAMSLDLDKIKDSLSTIQEESYKVNQINQDLTYKFRVFEKEAQAHLNEIKSITAKYQESK